MYARAGAHMHASTLHQILPLKITLARWASRSDLIGQRERGGARWWCPMQLPGQPNLGDAPCRARNWRVYCTRSMHACKPCADNVARKRTSVRREVVLKPAVVRMQAVLVPLPVRAVPIPCRWVVLTLQPHRVRMSLLSHCRKKQTALITMNVSVTLRFSCPKSFSVFSCGCCGRTSGTLHGRMSSRWCAGACVGGAPPVLPLEA